jgi:hypothetical protein
MDLSGFIPKIPGVGVNSPTPSNSNPDAPSTTPAGTSTSGNSSPLLGGSTPAGAVAGAIAGTIFPGAGLLFGMPTQRIVLIALGLLLIAAGIFAFRPVRETVIETAKTGAKAAAVAA